MEASRRGCSGSGDGLPHHAAGCVAHVPGAHTRPHPAVSRHHPPKGLCGTVRRCACGSLNLKESESRESGGVAKCAQVLRARSVDVPLLSSAAAAAHMLHERGLCGLWRGAPVRCVEVAAGGVIFFSMLEGVQRLLPPLAR